MWTLQVASLDGPDGLELTEVPDPSDPGMVVIDVRAAGVSFADLLITQGRYQVRPPLPFTPGLEVAGTVRAAPAGSGLQPGQRVAAAVPFGGFAQVALADPARTMPIPDELPFAPAGGFLVNYQTALFALQHRARLHDGEVVVVHGAGGGLGEATVQVARALGGQVVAVASTDAKREVARRSGALLVLGTDQDWRVAVLDRTGGSGADVIVDPVGGDRFDESLRCLASGGRLVTVGFAAGRIPAAPANRLLLRNSGVLGAAWGEFLDTDPGYFRAAGATLSAMLQHGAITPGVGRSYPLEHGADALRDLHERRAIGKLVLETGR